MAFFRVAVWGVVAVALTACGGASSSDVLSGADGSAGKDGSASGSSSGGMSSGGTTSGGSSSGASSSGGSSSGGPGDASADSPGESADTGTPADTGTAQEGGAACAGAECGGWAAALSAASSLRGAAGASADQALANCVIQLHQSDCCGARRAYGFNHAARTQLCTAESTCTMTYPSSPGCTSTTITTDTGETTTDPSQVRLRVVDPMSCTYGTCYTCETFVCTGKGGSCTSAPGIMPMQCG